MSSRMILLSFGSFAQQGIFIGNETIRIKSVKKK